MLERKKATWGDVGGDSGDGKALPSPARLKGNSKSRSNDEGKDPALAPARLKGNDYDNGRDNCKIDWMLAILPGATAIEGVTWQTNLFLQAVFLTR